MTPPKEPEDDDPDQSGSHRGESSRNEDPGPSEGSSAGRSLCLCPSSPRRAKETGRVLNRSVVPASGRLFGAGPPGPTPTALYSAVPCFHSPQHDSVSDRCHPGNELWSRGKTPWE